MAFDYGDNVMEKQIQIRLSVNKSTNERTKLIYSRSTAMINDFFFF